MNGPLLAAAIGAFFGTSVAFRIERKSRKNAELESRKNAIYLAQIKTIAHIQSLQHTTSVLRSWNNADTLLMMPTAKQSRVGLDFDYINILGFLSKQNGELLVSCNEAQRSITIAYEIIDQRDAYITAMVARYNGTPAEEIGKMDIRDTKEAKRLTVSSIESFERALQFNKSLLTELREAGLTLFPEEPFYVLQ